MEVRKVKYRFRGKSIVDIEHMGIKKGDWVYGTYLDGYIINEVIEATEDYITIGSWVAVDMETVGQFTGLHDKNGKEIYEGDVVKCKNYHGEIEGDVDYGNSCFYIACSSGYSDEYLFNCFDLEVIGTIHDKAGDE